MKFHAIILAAGYGSRLSPLTDQIPKPLLPIAGKPMLIRILEKLKEAGADRIAVNTHHLAEQVERCIRESEFADSVTVYNEPEILGTGGPLVNAKELLADGECFLLHNCDAVTDFDLSALIREHCQSGATATMALIDGPENRVLTEQGMIRSIVGRPHAEAGPEAKNMTYACVAAFSRDIFEYLPQSPCNCSLIDGSSGRSKRGSRCRDSSRARMRSGRISDPFSSISTFTADCWGNRCAGGKTAKWIRRQNSAALRQSATERKCSGARKWKTASCSRKRWSRPGIMRGK